MNDEPSAPGLSLEEVAEIQRHLANVPMHMIPTELKNIEMKLDREKLEEQKNKEEYCRKKLDRMTPVITFRLPLGKHAVGDYSVAIDLGEGYKQARGEQSKEAQVQRHRESTIFQQIYMNPNMIPVNPLKELDELYVKDETVIQFDCEVRANEYYKERDDELFAKEMKVIEQELLQLDEGKRSDLAKKLIKLLNNSRVANRLSIGQRARIVAMIHQT